MHFLYPQLLWLGLSLLPLLYFLKSAEGALAAIFTPETLKQVLYRKNALSNRTRNTLVLLALLFGLLALARPVQEEGTITVAKSSVDLVVGFDISRSMFADDVYPTRFDLARRKFDSLLKHFKEGNVAVIGFSAKGFLVAPLSRDFHTLRYLVDNMSPQSVSQQGTDVLAALRSAQDLMKNSQNKALLLFTDGGDATDFSEAIAYAKTHGILVYVYAIGTDQGGVIKEPEGGVLKDAQGNIVIPRLNSAIKTLALQSGGAYLRYSLKEHDLDPLIRDIERKFKKQEAKDETVTARKELFVYPLGLTILLFLVAISSLPGRTRSAYA